MTRTTKVILIVILACALAYGLNQYADVDPAVAIALAMIAGFVGILLT